LCGEIGRKGLGCGCDLSLTLREKNEEEKFLSPRDYLPALLGIDQGNNNRRDYLGYPAQFSVQSNNNTTIPRII
jgi:hypothetical protein